jgi:hypothetical protein
MLYIRVRSFKSDIVHHPRTGSSFLAPHRLLVKFHRTQQETVPRPHPPNYNPAIIVLPAIPHASAPPARFSFGPEVSHGPAGCTTRMPHLYTHTWCCALLPFASLASTLPDPFSRAPSGGSSPFFQRCDCRRRPSP